MFLISGGQILLHKWEMLRQVIKSLLYASMGSILFFFVFKTYLELQTNDIKKTIVYYKAEWSIGNGNPTKQIKFNREILLNSNKNIRNNKNNNITNVYYYDNTNNTYQVNNYNSNNNTNIKNKEQKFSLPANVIINNRTFIKSKERTIQTLKKNMYFSLEAYVYMVFGTMLLFCYHGYRVMKTNYLRGGKITKQRILNFLIKNYNGIFYRVFNKKYSIAGIRYPKHTEGLHTLITGTTGQGKTVVISNLIEQIRNNGDRAIIYDKMGTFIEKFYNPETDIILNQLDDRSPYWSIFNEVRNVIDFETIARALIPENSKAGDPFFTDAARILFSNVAAELYKDGCTSNKILAQKLLTVNLKEAAQLVKGTPAQSIIDPENPKTALSVMSVLSTNLKSLTYLREDSNSNGEIFSIRDWINNDKQKGFLFLSSREDQHETLKPLISTWIDISINALLSLNKSKNRKIWVGLDELPSLNFLPSLSSGLAESRQFGGCFVLGIQSPAQMRSIYGADKTEATSGLCNTRIIFKTPDEETAKWCSDSLGKVEVEETKESISFGVHSYRDGVSLSKNMIQKTLVLPTEIMNLDKLTGYIKVSGNFPIAKIKIKPKKYEKKAIGFIERESLISNLNNTGDKESGGNEDNKNKNNKVSKINEINKGDSKNTKYLNNNSILSPQLLAIQEKIEKEKNIENQSEKNEDDDIEEGNNEEIEDESNEDYKNNLSEIL